MVRSSVDFSRRDYVYVDELSLTSFVVASFGR